MRHLRRIPSNNPKWKFWLWGRKYYYLDFPYVYYSAKYDNSITVPAGKYDGATMAIDVCPNCWLVHDTICDVPYFDDGQPINSEMAADILSQLLKEDGRNIRAFTWKHMTRLFGCKNARKNDKQPS